VGSLMELFSSDDPKHISVLESVSATLAPSLDELWRHHVTLKDAGMKRVVDALNSLEVQGMSLAMASGPALAVVADGDDSPLNTDAQRYASRLVNISRFCDKLFRTFGTPSFELFFFCLSPSHLT
jgi:hypothetical protein